MSDTARWWTEEDRQRLRDMWRDAVALEVIAERLGRTPASVRSAASRDGLGPMDPRLWPAAERQRLREMWRDGVALEVIAERLGRTVTGVRAAARRDRLGPLGHAPMRPCFLCGQEFSPRTSHLRYCDPCKADELYASGSDYWLVRQ